jgi:hypothetical protein
MLAELFQDGIIVDLILIVVAVEAVALLFLRRGLHKGPAVRDWLPNLLSGTALLVALRLSMAQAAWTWVAVALAFSLVAHVTDMARRFQSV